MDYFYHDMFLVIVTIAIMAGICLGLLIAITVYLLSRRGNFSPTTNDTPPPVNQSKTNSSLTMIDEPKEILSKLDKMRQEYIRGKRENVSYILWGFTLAMVGLTVSYYHPANVAITIIFLILGGIMWIRARLVKVQ